MIKKNTPPQVSIVILNWNGWRDTIECLESLYQSEYQNYNIIVVDNASTDNSIDKIKEYCKGNLRVSSFFFDYSSQNKPILICELTDKSIRKRIVFKHSELKFPSHKKLFLIKNNKNFGYTGGNNIGCIFSLKNLNSDYIFILNNDTVIDRKCLQELIEFIEFDNKIGIIGPEIRRYSNPKLIQFENKYFDIKTPTEVDWVSGCAYIIRSEIIRKIGLLDPRYLFYYEETDYYQRVRREGYTIIYYPTKKKVFHKISSTAKKIPGFTLFYMSRNFFIFTKKYSKKMEFFLKSYKFLKNGLILHLKNPRRDLYYFLKGSILGFFLSLFVKQVKEMRNKILNN